MSAHFGHRDNPAVVVAPNDLDRAVLRTWQPTPEQASAGNYKMAHAILGTWDRKSGRITNGIEVTIETPRERTRSGIGPDGTPWSVVMPAHYGYVKGTKGADDDHVDVYVGPEAHRVAALPVWVVDQCDADTKAFDEHKCMLGFVDSGSARDTYVSAFSDGRGRERVGGVTRMTFDAFREWLASGKTKSPVATAKSALDSSSAAPYGSLSKCRCESQCSCTKSSGGSMTIVNPAAKTESTTFMGRLSAVVAKGLASMTPSERLEFMADAAVKSTSELGKASEILDHKGERGSIHQIEDQWDGPPDDKAETVRAHGPDSSVPGGKVPVGPNQASSGDGAEKMEREYSRHAPQTGVQRATEELGEAVMGIRKAMKSIIGAIESQGVQIEALKSGVASVAMPDAAAIGQMVQAAVAKALSPIEKSIVKLNKAVVAKAESDKESDKEDGEDDEEEDDEATESESGSGSGSGTDIEIVNETDAEGDSDADDEDEKAKAIQAAKCRLIAKSYIKWANRRLSKAEEMDEDGKPKTAENMRKKARFDMKKARVFLAKANELRDDRAGPSSKAIAKAIAKAVAKAGEKTMKPEAKNQDKWPNKGEEGTGKSVADANPALAALQQAAADIAKAASGIGMLSTNVNGLFDSMSGRSRNGDNLPPAFNIALAKGGDDIASKEREIMTLAEQNVITFDELEKSRDVIGLVRMKNVPQEVITAKVARLPQAARDVLTRAAA